MSRRSVTELMFSPYYPSNEQQRFQLPQCHARCFALIRYFGATTLRHHLTTMMTHCQCPLD
jgi:hypothetical protein